MKGVVMDRFTDFGFGNLTEEWIERKFTGLMFLFFLNFGSFLTIFQRGARAQ